MDQDGAHKQTTTPTPIELQTSQVRNSDTREEKGVRFHFAPAHVFTAKHLRNERTGKDRESLARRLYFAHERANI